MEDIYKIIQEDRKSNPNCNYTHSLSRSCKHQNDEFVCNIVKQITRKCPNDRPQVIFSQDSRESFDINDKTFQNNYIQQNEKFFSFSFGHNNEPSSIFEKEFGIPFNSFMKPFITSRPDLEDDSVSVENQWDDILKIEKGSQENKKNK